MENKINVLISEYHQICKTWFQQFPFKWATNNRPKWMRRTKCILLPFSRKMCSSLQEKKLKLQLFFSFSRPFEFTNESVFFLFETAHGTCWICHNQMHIRLYSIHSESACSNAISEFNCCHVQFWITVSKWQYIKK